MSQLVPGPDNSILDVPGLRVGQAQDARLKTGVTLLLGAEPLTASVHVMGGAPGTRETDLLAPDKTVEQVHGLLLSGGSAFGLGAADGVMERLREAGVGFEVGPARVPILPAAILFDLLSGGDDSWRETPFPALGRAAFDAATSHGPLALGTVGAGTGAIAGRVKGGLGSASLRLPSGATVAALVAANPVGNVLAPCGRFYAAPYEIGNEFGGLGLPEPADLAASFATKLDAMHQPASAGQGGNTTIAIIATDAPLSKPAAHRLAVAAHDGMARAILPAHTPMDGDLVFAASTGRGPSCDPLTLGHGAALCLSRAIARGVWAACPAAGDPMPTARSLL